MKATSKRKLFTILFSCICVLFSLIFAFYLCDGFDNFRDPSGGQYEVKELVTLEKGEKIKFTEVNSYFKEYVNDRKTLKYEVHAQDAEPLSGTWLKDKNMRTEEGYENRSVYVDENGYLNAAQTGVYKFAYSVFLPDGFNQHGSAFHSYPEMFSNVVAVYASEEEYVPFPRSLAEFESYRYTQDAIRIEPYAQTANYILTQDITIDQAFYEEWSLYYARGFEGCIINPNGYTITLNVRTPALFSVNYGILDGLKVKFVSSENASFTDGFYGLAKENYGVIKDCTLLGDVYVQSGTATLFPYGGYVLENQAELSLYCDGSVIPFAEMPWNIQHTENFNSNIIDTWINQNNTAKMEAYYYTNDLLCRRRNVNVTDTRNNNVCYRPSVGEYTGEACAVTYKIPYWGKEYEELQMSYPRYSVMEIPSDFWPDVWGFNNDLEYGNLEVLYWLVNGEKVEDMNDVLIEEDMVVEPCVKNKTTKYLFGKFGDDSKKKLYNAVNADDVLYLSDPEDEEKAFVLDYYTLNVILENPHNVLPSKIVFGAGCEPWFYDVFSEESAKSIEKYLQNGGKIEIESGNRYFAFIDEKMFCTDGGKTLVWYFPEEGETEISLHPQIKDIDSTAFTLCEEMTSLDLSYAENFAKNIFKNNTALEKVHFGKQIVLLDSINSTWYSNFRDLLLPATSLREITIDENNRYYYAEDNFVISKKGGYTSYTTLQYSLPSLKGEVTLPEGIEHTSSNSLTSTEIEVVNFPDSFLAFNDGVFTSTEKLKAIRFGNSESIAAHATMHREYPALTEVSFGENVKRVDFIFSMFKNAPNLGVVKLPKSLEYASMFLHCKGFEIDSSNEHFQTVDGVLYGDSSGGYTLLAYPIYREGTRFEVPDGVHSIGSYAFAHSMIEEIVVPESIRNIKMYAFMESAIERVILNTSSIIISQAAFDECAALESVTVSEDNTLLYLDYYVFRDCISLTSFPSEKATTICDQAFMGAGLESFDFGAGLTWLGTGAFEGSRLKKATFAPECTVVPKDGTFKDTPLESVTLGGLTHISREMFKNTNLFAVSSENVIEIGSEAFRGCKNLKTVIFPVAQSFNGVAAFAESGVETVYLPKLVNVEAETFSGCGSLTSVTFAETIQVGEKSFYGCEKLGKIEAVIESSPSVSAFEGCSLLEKLAFEWDGLFMVGENAFKGCASLKELTITAQTVVLDEWSLSDCGNFSLLKITQTGIGGGKISSQAFAAKSTVEVEVYLNVSDGFEWEGKIEKNYTVYVPNAIKEELIENWLIGDAKIVGYEF